MRFSKDILTLNPHLAGDTRRKATAVHADRADWLLEALRVHAPDLPAPVRDHPFGSFRIDLAWPGAGGAGGAGVAAEVNGGLKRAGGGKHATSRDHQKVRQLVLAGWAVLVFTSSEVVHDPLMCIEDIRCALAQKEV